MKSRGSLHGAFVASVIAGFMLGGGGISAADARQVRNGPRDLQSRAPGTPLLAIIGLREQRVSVYDAIGKIMEAPVSTGTTGRETPAGIFSIVQKEEEHHSSLYDDASMPFMERITWTGISLHAGVLPGYPASHGCVRMPEGFAERLYQLTKLGMRVIIVREDIAPAAIAQPALFTPRATSPDKAAGATEMADPSGDGGPAAIRVAGAPADAAASQSLERHLDALRSIAVAKAGEAEAAAKREKEARRAETRIAADAAAALRGRHAAETNAEKAEAELKAVQSALETTGSPEKTAEAETAKAAALAKLAAARAQLQTAKRDEQAKSDAAARAREEVRAATAAKNIAADAAEAAEHNLSPVSVFISRKTQRLYIRKGNIPVFESPVAIRDVDQPIGTFVFTALGYTGTPGELRWSVVSMYRDAAHVEPYVPVKRPAKARATEPAPADAASAEAALDRLAVPEEARDRIAEVVLPGSSLIVSDEGASIETGKDTDFIVVMSGEPQGGMTIRLHDSASRPRRYQDEDRPWRYRDEDGPPRSGRGRRPSGDGFPFLFSD